MSGRRIAQVLGTSTGGIGTHVASVTRELLSRGDRVTVYGPAATNEQFGFHATGARFVPVEIPDGTDPVAHARAAATLRRTLTGASGAKPDVVHAHGLRAGLASLTAKPAGTSLVVSWHIDHAAGGESKLLAGATWTMAQGADISLCTDRNHLAQLYSKGAKDVRYAPIAAPSLPAPARTVEDVKSELGVEGRSVVLSVGRLHQVKRFDVLIEAASTWTSDSQKPVVLIAGDGPMRQQLASQVQSNGADVRLLGHRSDIADLLAAADVAVVTSDSETRQFFAQEALRSGTPLVATRVGGLPELIGDAAVMIEPGNSGAVAEATMRVLTQDTLRTDLAEAAQKQVAAWPSEEDTIDHLDAVYRELTGR
ncbi:MAG TPA: glycosyltransferase family 4 protein [Candidatus Stackebrandtia faecavium]|nr:glycosyltransferase family 4 protein [Candidatus Stackebrandtia faecavium]